MTTHDHSDLRRAAALLSDFPGPWGVAGGWAIDLFVGHQSRTHADLDVAVLRANQRDLRHVLASARVEKVIRGEFVPWLPDEALLHPVHEVHATWADGYRLEFLLDESDRHDWLYRRDARVRRALAAAFRRDAIIPYLAPEIVLLFKSKAPAAKDGNDFAAVSSLLSDESRSWLLDALAYSAPGHPWAEILAREA